MWGTDAARGAILLFAMVNAALFSVLLPLWAGFDEPSRTFKRFPMYTGGF